MSRIPTLVLALFGASGCVVEQDTSSEQPESSELQAGDYEVSDLRAESDDLCSYGPDEVAFHLGEVSVGQASDGRFVFLPAASYLSTECGVDDAAFVCDVVEVTPVSGATYDMLWTFSGTITGSQEAEVTVDLSYVCTVDTGCIDGLPCEDTFSGVLSLAEEV